MEREQVMLAMQCCIMNTVKGCEACPYNEYTDCDTRMVADALALLKAADDVSKGDKR